MPFETDKVAYVPTGGRGTKYDGNNITMDASGISDPLLPEINEYTINLSSANNLNQYGTVVYNTSNFAFHYMEKTRELNSSQSTTQYRPFLRINIPIITNTIPAISGIKIIGTAFSTSTKALTSQVSPYGNNSTLNNSQRTFMFKIWRNFNWIASQNSAPFYPKLNKPEGEVEFYASTGEGHNYTFNQNQLSIHTKDMIFVNEANAGPVMDSLFGTNAFTDTGWTAEDQAAGKRTITYELIAGFNDSNFGNDYEYSVIKGFVTTY